ncbi:MAG: leucine-rich repeat domain-containing protein, partial [Clostridia bacterium]|nr:leucine-rich repeat domain-containing protein [Clostridia bacterium]
YAFDGASKIVSLIVPEGIKTAGNYAFRSMTGMITVEFKGIEEIGQYAFSGCSKLTDVDLGPALKKIDDYAFQGVAYINKITFPDTIEYIGYQAFYNSTNLAEINIPDKAFEIQADAFYGTAWYNAQPNGEVYLNTIFYQYKGSYPSVDTVITIKDGTKAIAACAFFQKYYNIIEIIIPDSVQFIGYKAFYDCEELKKVNIPDGITSIEYYTFGECSGLTELVIPESVTNFETYAFYNCYNLKSINIPSGVTSIPDHTFYNCQRLESIEIPDGVTTIDRYAFYNCDALTEVEIPNGVTFIGEYAFYDCGGLKSISIPDSVTSVGSSAFYNCPAVETLHLGKNTATLGRDTYNKMDKLKEITVSADNETLCAVDGVLFSKDMTTLIKYPEAKEDVSYTIPSTVTTIKEYAFRNNDKLTSVTIPEGVTTIEQYAFEDCDALTSVTVPKSVTTMGTDAFANCGALADITLADGLTVIGTYAFYNCDALTSVTVPGSIATLSNCAFCDCDGITEVTLKEGVETIGERAFESCDALTTVDFADSIKNINYKAFYSCTKLTNLVLPKYIENIGERAFANCGALTEVTIPGTVTSIGDYAFQSCTSLTEVVYEEGTTITGYGAFYGCKLLKNVTLPSTMSTISTYTFDACYALDEIILPENLTTIGNYSFYDCDALAEIVIPDSVTSLGSYAFSNCEKLESVTIGSGVKTIGDRAFQECIALKSITVPGTVTTVGQEAFYGCAALESIILEDGVTTIKADAFRNCTALTSVDIPASITSITSDLFAGCTSLAAINVAEDNETYSSEDGVVYNKDKTVLMMYPVGKTDESFVIPSTVKEIKAEAFKDNAYLKNITIPEGVETIGASNFYNCDALVSITVPDSVTSVGNAFCAYSGSLETVVLGSGMTSVPYNAFYGDNDPKYLTIPSSITYFNGYSINYLDGTTIYYLDVLGKWNAIGGYRGLNSTVTVICLDCPTAHANAYVGEYLAPTCTVKGHEAGKYCPDCLVWIEPQTAIAALNHANKYNTDRVEPTCTEVGYTAGVYCPDCQSYISGHSTISKLNHPTKVREENKAPTCTVDGFYGGLLCTTCGEYVEERVDIPATNHEGTTSTFAEEKATCTESGFTAGEFCNSCGEWVSGHEVIPAINHANAEVYEAVPATCTVSGYTEGKYCPDCRTWLVAREYVAALGHTNTEWTQISAPTCTSAGKEQSVCDVCGATVYRNLDKADHAYGAWITEKEATVLSEGLEVRTCDTCGHRDVKTIDRINVDGDENYGVVNFTVVNAQTLSPIKGASLYIATENDGENTFYTDADGKVSVTLPIGEQTVSAYAKNCLTRSFKITVVNGENDIPVIGLSDKSTYDAELTQKVMTKEEIEDAGIDTEAIGNQQVVKTEMKLVFDDVPPIVVETYTAGGKVVGIADTPANVVVEGEGYYSRPGSTANYYYRPPVNDQPSIIIQPVSERCYLIIRGEIKWLKEMFDVELLVVNNSATDTLEDLKATLTLPDGLSLADMIDGEQTLEQEMGTVTESSSKSVHWYVRGDKAGSYDLAAQLTGKIMPLGEEINDTFTCEDQLQVWAGNALHLHYEFPNSAYFGEDYPVTITLTNVSDRTLYNVSHLITEVEQGKIIYDPADGTKDIVYTSESDESWFAFAPEFKPGDKLVIELSIEILFGSEYMLKEIEEIFGDYAAEFVNGYEAVMSGLDAASTLIATVSAAAEALEKANIESELAEMLRDIEKSLVSGDKVFTAAAMLVDTGLAQELELIGEDAAAWAASADIEAVTANVEALKKAIVTYATEEETAAFNIFDSLRTLVTSLPTKFILGDVIFNQEGTTTIPWSYSITGIGPEYYGVSNIGSRLNGVSQAIIGATGDEVSSYLQLIPGIDNPENYVDRDTSVIAVQNEKEQFKAKDATGTVKFTAYYVPAASYSLRNRSVSAENYTLECDNESAVFENGVLTFTGDGTISLTSADANGGVLYIEDDKGNTYSYAVNVVEAHDCIAGIQKTVLSPTSEYDGFAVKCCEICDDVMEIVNLTLCDEHTFGDWATEIEANCIVGGVKKRICTSCGYAETDFIATSGHTETTVNKKDATCTESGYTGDTVCGACGAEISKGQTVDALKHNMGTFTVTKEATCTADGEERADCSRCDYYETKVISAKGHTEEILAAVNATCSKPGLTEGKKCSVCGEILVKQTETAKLEHSYKSVVTAPSCTNGGYTTYTCSVCKYAYKANETAKLGHNMGDFIVVEQPSCTENGLEIAECSRCDYSEVNELSATGHNYQNGVCTECGDSKSNNCSCNCHKSGFMSIIWKILRFFYKLFGTNKICGCGVAHY